MNTPPELRYTASHEWVRLDGERATVGITDFAQHELGDVVYLELPQAGRTYEQGAAFGTVESVKAVSDLYAPISGEVLEVNDALTSQPETLNTDPYGAGWMLVLRPGNPSEIAGLLDAAAYEAGLAVG